MTWSLTFAAVSTLVGLVHGQQVGTNTAEVNPPLTWQKCTTSGGCSTISGSVTIDANYRWTHQVGGYTNCKTDSGAWNTSICADPVSCAKQCAVEGVDYSSSGVATSGSALTVTLTTATNSGPRVYLLDSTGKAYQPFKLLAQEFTFDVSLPQVGCGMNAALYFSEMDINGGAASTNAAGPKYGTGYCDAQCPSGDNFINGQANFNGTQQCCNEMDIWEANAISNAYTTHGCLKDGPYACPSSGCSGQCDSGGCAFNPYQQGRKTFYGPGGTIDTSKTFTVVTQFLTDNGLSTGNLVEIRRIYVQNGVVIQNPTSTTTNTNSITTSYCSQIGAGPFANVGGMTPLTTAFKKGMVLAISLWDDPSPNGMSWLDGYPDSGTCTGGVNTTLPKINATFSNIKLGDINTTYPYKPPTTSVTTSKSSTVTSKTTSKTSSTPSSTGCLSPKWAQCGGQGWTGCKACVSGTTCTYSNPYYSQCL